MSRVTDTRRALAARLDELDGRVRVIPGPSTYDDRGMDRVAFLVTVLVGPPSDETVQARLDDMLAPDGVKATLEADRSLGGLVADLSVTRCSGYEPHGTDEQPLLGATWTVETVT